MRNFIETEADNWVQKIQQTIDGVDATGHSGKQCNVLLSV